MLVGAKHTSTYSWTINRPLDLSIIKNSIALQFMYNWQWLNAISLTKKTDTYRNIPRKPKMPRWRRNTSLDKHRNRVPETDKAKRIAATDSQPSALSFFVGVLWAERLDLDKKHLKWGTQEDLKRGKEIKEVGCLSFSFCDFCYLQDTQQGGPQCTVVVKLVIK